MAHANLGFYVTPVGKNSENMAQRRRIPVAFRREKFGLTAKIRRICEKYFRKSSYFGRIAKNSRNIFLLNFGFWAKIRRTAKNSQNQRNAKNSQKRRILVALRKIRKNSQVRRRYAVAGENASQIRRKSVALRKIPKIFQNFQNFGYIFLIF